MNLVVAPPGIFTGPIDDLVMTYSTEICPACGSPLVLAPAQHGYCHSGRYATSCSEHYWCEICEESFVVQPDQPTGDHFNDR